jgi:2-keto-4-pentenoate hydratase
MELARIVNDTGFLYTKSIPPPMKNSTAKSAVDIRRTAGEFVRARLHGLALPEYPGAMLTDLAEAYACQDAAIGRWPDQIGGWKVGRILPPWLARYGEERLVGPIFRQTIRTAHADTVVDFPIFEGGFAAVEAEFVFLLGEDAPPRRSNWTAAEAQQLVSSLHIGIETAGSPLATINELGPAAVISDFGNNAGLIVGAQIAGWQGLPLESLRSQMFIEEAAVGTGSAASLPGGPLAALAFTLGKCAARNVPLKAGQFVSTGATTGIHVIRVGARARADFGPLGAILCRAVRVTPESARGDAHQSVHADPT